MLWPRALLLLLLLCCPLVGVRADPVISSPSPWEGLAQWTFSNPGNYTLSATSLDGLGAILAWSSGLATDTSQADFSLARSRVNIDLASNPGAVALLNTSQPGPVQNLSLQPDGSSLADNYLYKGNGGNINFGSSPNIRVGNYGGNEWNRGLIQFPSFPLPSNATIRTALLRLYMHHVNGTAMDVGVYRVPTPWTESGSTWNTRDGIIPWNSTGGDFDPTAVDVVAALGATPGWYTWNITSLVQRWWAGSIPNQGLMVRQVDDNLTQPGIKDFYSSDSPYASLRPQLNITYTTPSSRGSLESRIIDAGGVSQWGELWSNATVPAGASVAIQTRTGNYPTVNASWSPWSAPHPSPGRADILSPEGRYIQYRVLLFTPSSLSPLVQDISLAFGHFAASGSVTTQPLLPPNLSQWGRLEANWSGPPGTSVVAAYSQDNGTSWAPASLGANLTGALPQALILRLTLATGNTTLAPRLRGFSLGFAPSIGPGGGGGNPPPGGFPLWLALLPLGLPLAWAIARGLLREPFRPTDLFLIHADGRLVLHVGGEESPLQDELAASGMFTLVARFVKDSFAGAGGGGGELKSLRVDEREVAIAKGDYLFLALVAEGARPPGLEAAMVEFLRELEVSRRDTLEQWDGLAAGLGDLEAQLRRFLGKGCRRGRWHPPQITGADKRPESLKTPGPQAAADAQGGRGERGTTGPHAEDMPGGGPRRG